VTSCALFDAPTQTQLFSQEATNLSVILLQNLDQLEAVNRLESCRELKAIRIFNCCSLEVVGLDQLPNLDYLDISGCPKLAHLKVSGCTELARLEVSECTSLSRLEMEECGELQEVKLTGLAALRQLRLEASMQASIWHACSMQSPACRARGCMCSDHHAKSVCCTGALML
jgi:hypothetical protein